MNREINIAINQLLRKELSELKPGSPMHQYAVMHILIGALRDANFATTIKNVPKIFPKAEYDGDNRNERTITNMYKNKIGPKIAKIANWDGKDIVNGIGFYVSMQIGRPMGQKIEQLVEGKNMKLEQLKKMIREIAKKEMLKEEEINWNAVQNAIINFLKTNTKILDKKVQSKDIDGVKGGLKSILSGLTNAQRSLKLESASRTAMEIGGLTGLNKDAVQKFVDTHNLDIEKVFQFVKKGKLSDRMDFVAAVSSPILFIRKKIIKKLQESVNEEKYSDQTGIKSSLLNDSEFTHLFQPKVFNWIRGKDVKIFKVQNYSNIFTISDGNMEIVVNISKPVSVIKPYGRARREVKDLFSKTESVNEAKKYDIGSGYLGNGLTIWNRAEKTEDDNYETIAHIGKDGKLTIYDKEIPADIKKMIGIWATSMKKGNRPGSY